MISSFSFIYTLNILFSNENDIQYGITKPDSSYVSISNTLIMLFTIPRVSYYLNKKKKTQCIVYSATKGICKVLILFTAVIVLIKIDSNDCFADMLTIKRLDEDGVDI